MKGDENEIYKTEGEEKNLDERSYLYIDQSMRRPFKKILHMKMEKLSNLFMKQGYTSKRKASVFPTGYQSQDKNQQDQQQLFVPNLQPQKYVEQKFEENKNYMYQFQQEKPVTTQKIKENFPKESKPPPGLLSLKHDTEIHRNIKHQLFEQHYKDHAKPKRKYPYARHRLNYNYGIASYPMRRSALKTQVRQNAEKDGYSSASASYPTNDKYVQLLEEIANVIDLDVDNVMKENKNENNRNSNVNGKRAPCKNCFRIFNEPEQKSRTASLLGCTCENMNVKQEPLGKIIKISDEKYQTTSESGSNDYSMT